MSDENDNRAGPSPAAAIGGSVANQHLRAKFERDRPFAELLHRALAARYGLKSDNEEGE